MHKAPAIVVLGPGSLATARRIQQCYPQASIHGLQGRVEGVDVQYLRFGDTLRQLFCGRVALGEGLVARVGKLLEFNRAQLAVA